MPQQKQRKQLTLTDNKNTSTYRFQSIQGLQPNLMIDDIRNFMSTKHNGDNAKLIISSFTPQRQRIKANFMSDSIRNFIHDTYQTTKHTHTHTQPEQPNSAVFIFKHCKILVDLVHFIHHKFCTFHQPPKLCT